MKDKDITRLMAGGSLAIILAVHWLPKRLLPFSSPGLAALLILGSLLATHRYPLRSLWRDVKASVEEPLSSSRVAAGEASDPDSDGCLDQG